MVFCALQTQWRRTPMGRPAGIDYAAVPVVMSMYGIDDEDRSEVFDGLQQMEIQALRIWRKQA